MPMENIIKQPQYDFLNTNPLLGPNIILLALGGSYAYGTTTPTSDIDIRGCALEQKKHLLTNHNFEQVTDNTTDTVIYSLKKMVSLLSACNPNIIEILGCRPGHYLKITPAGQMLLDNKQLFLSKEACKSFGGYASAQLRRLDNKTARKFTPDENERHICDRLKEMRPYDSISFAVKNTGSHNEICISGRFTNIPFREFYTNIAELNQTVREYERNSKRNKNAIEHGKIAKHMTHLLRLYMMLEDILKDGEIVTYRTKEHNLLMDIRNGKFLDKNEQPTKEFFDLVKEYEDRTNTAKIHSDLPDKPDYEKINQLLINIYETYVF